MSLASGRGQDKSCFLQKCNTSHVFFCQCCLSAHGLPEIPYMLQHFAMKVDDGKLRHFSDDPVCPDLIWRLSRVDCLKAESNKKWVPSQHAREFEWLFGRRSGFGHSFGRQIGRPSWYGRGVSGTQPQAESKVLSPPREEQHNESMRDKRITDCCLEVARPIWRQTKHEKDERCRQTRLRILVSKSRPQFNSNTL